MPFSNTYANNILNWALGKSNALSVHSKVYIGLSSNDPEADGGTFTELSGNGYSRVLVSQYNETYPNVIGSAANRTIKNTAQINWTKATGNWVTANGFGLFTSETGGTPYYYGKLDAPMTCVEGAVALFDPNTFEISFSATDAEA